jgi:hypothetical protein
VVNAPKNKSLSVCVSHITCGIGGDEPEVGLSSFSDPLNASISIYIKQCVCVCVCVCVHACVILHTYKIVVNISDKFAR